MHTNTFPDDAQLIGRLEHLLKPRGWMACTAESCTGGLAGALFTHFAGSSDYFAGGLITYTNALKNHLLGVSQDMLDHFGAVSEPVVQSMAEGALKACMAQCSIAYSGIAGPGGGSVEKPVGTVCMAAAVPLPTRCRTAPSVPEHRIIACCSSLQPLQKEGWHFAVTANALLSYGTRHFSGDRSAIRAAAARCGLLLLANLLDAATCDT